MANRLPSQRIFRLEMGCEDAGKLNTTGDSIVWFRVTYAMGCNSARKTKPCAWLEGHSSGSGGSVVCG